MMNFGQERVSASVHDKNFAFYYEDSRIKIFSNPALLGTQHLFCDLPQKHWISDGLQELKERFSSYQRKVTGRFCSYSLPPHLVG
jgi:hypothetical protein